MESLEIVLEEEHLKQLGIFLPLDKQKNKVEFQNATFFMWKDIIKTKL